MLFGGKVTNGRDNCYGYILQSLINKKVRTKQPLINQVYNQTDYVVNKLYNTCWGLSVPSSGQAGAS